MGTYYHAFAVSKDRSRIASPVFQTHRVYVLRHDNKYIFEGEEALSRESIEKLVELAKKDGRDGRKVCCLPSMLNEGMWFGGYVPPFHVMPAPRFIQLVREAERRFEAEDDDGCKFEPDDMTTWLGDYMDLDVVVYPRGDVT